MVKQSEFALNGMKEICFYVGRSETTVLDWIRNRDFPAKQLKKGGIWGANKLDVDRWWKNTFGEYRAA